MTYNALSGMLSFYTTTIVDVNKQQDCCITESGPPMNVSIYSYIWYDSDCSCDLDLDPIITI